MAASTQFLVILPSKMGKVTHMSSVHGAFRLCRISMALIYGLTVHHILEPPLNNVAAVLVLMGVILFPMGPMWADWQSPCSWALSLCACGHT